MFSALNQVQKPFEDASFALKVGNMSGPVFTDSGVHMILRTGCQEDSTCCTFLFHHQAHTQSLTQSTLQFCLMAHTNAVNKAAKPASHHFSWDQFVPCTIKQGFPFYFAIIRSCVGSVNKRLSYQNHRLCINFKLLTSR